MNCLTEIFPQLRGWGEAPCRPFSVEAIAESGARLAFLATPHEASHGTGAATAGGGLARRGLERRIPLSRSRRHSRIGTSCPRPIAALLAQAVYGLPELYGDAVAEARLVANPGCYPTSVILGLRPLVEAGWIARERGIVCDCKSGASGAGKEPKRELHFVEVDENFRAYGLFTHRHTPEVTEHLGLAAGRSDVFHASAAAWRGEFFRRFTSGSNRGASQPRSKRCIGRFYAGRPMVRLWPAGRLPELQHVAHTNFCDIGFCAGFARRAAGGGELPRQSRQGRGGPGSAKHERDDGLRGGNGSAMRMVVKIAGALLDDADAVRSLARQIAQLAQQGHELLVVHGGGKIFTATLKRMGIESRFINGLRVTDRETRDVAVMVLGGLLNKRMAGAVSAAGQPAIGLCASDAGCFLAEPMMHDEVVGALGFVGYLTGVNVEFLESLWRAGIVPVASCLGLGADGEIYNINADHMAAACAEYIHADRLIYMTDVAGVLDGTKVMKAVSCDEVEDLIRQHKVSGGMILKLEACKRALSAGVKASAYRRRRQRDRLAFRGQRGEGAGHARDAKLSCGSRSGPLKKVRKTKPAKAGASAEQAMRLCGSLPDEHLPASADRVRSRPRLLPLRPARAKVSGFPRRPGGKCAGLRAPADSCG